MRLKWFDCLALICTALLIAQVNEGFTSGVITLLGRAASIEPFCLNRVGLWGRPCKLTWGFIKQFSKVPNPAMCRQSQALELEPHWISLFIWIKISLDTRSAKSEVALMKLLCTVILTGSKPEGYWDLDLGETFRETFPPISEGQTGNQLCRQLYFFKQRKSMYIHFQDMNKPRVWLIHSQ